MKLWKSKKSIGCISSKSAPLKSETYEGDAVSDENAKSLPLLPILPAHRALSPAQSEDSGLAPERGTTYATIILPRNNEVNMGIAFIERNDLSLPPVVATLSLLGCAGDFLAPGDRIHQIDSISTTGLTNAEVMNLLCNGHLKKDNSRDKKSESKSAAVLEIEYSLPESISRNSLCVSTKIADILIERESGFLGLTLRGGGDLPLIVTYIRPNGPVARDGRVKAGDRLLRINNMTLVGKTLAEAQQIIKLGPHFPEPTTITIEYDVSVVQSVEFSLGPLLIEIERPMHDKLGLTLCSYPLNVLNEDQHNCDEIFEAGVFIESILPASIAERCGALSVGDQILSVDEIVIGHSVSTPAEVTSLLASRNGRPFIQLQIMPVLALVRRGCPVNSKYGFNTMEGRKSRATRQRFIRKSSLPLDNGRNVNHYMTTDINSELTSQKKLSSTSSDSFQTIKATSTLPQAYKKNIWREETFFIKLNCTPESGIILDTRREYSENTSVILKIQPGSAADICGCLQAGDRILSINDIYTLDAQTKQQLLNGKNIGDVNSGQNGNWLQLEIQFDMSDTVVPASGVFTVKLKRAGEIGFGISLKNGAATGGAIITDVKPGSTAHRTGSLQVGDVLLAIDNHSVQNYNADVILYDNCKDDRYVTFTVRRMRLPDFIFDAQQKLPALGNYLSCDTTAYENYGEVKTTAQLDYFREPSLENCKYLSMVMYNNSSNAWNSNMENSLSNQQIPSMEYKASSEFDAHISQQMNVDYSSTSAQMETSLYATYPTIQQQQRFFSASPCIFTVQIENKGGLHGIVLAGSDEGAALTISELVEGGSAYKNQQLKVGDEILAINEEPVKGLSLSYVTQLLQTQSDFVNIQVLRPNNNNIQMKCDTSDSRISQNHALYAKVVRNLHSPFNTDGSATSSKSSNKDHIFHVTLYKDKVYDDFGFSVSDGLYERGVFINRIRSGGPADISNILKPFDRIIQVNNMKTQDFDCCLTVPLIAAAGDKIDLMIQRSE